MCLTANQTATQAWKNKNKKNKRVVVWKLLRKSTNRTPFQGVKVQGGWFKAQYQSGYTQPYWWYETASITEGIHCYLTRAEARNHCNFMCRVVRCEAQVSDFVACDNNSKHAVFKKIWVPKEELK